MPFKLALAAIVHREVTGEDVPLRVGLLQQAHAWLQRIASGPLLGLRESDMGDLDRPWQFVTNGWVDFSEE